MKQFGMWPRARSAATSGASLCLPWLLGALLGGCVPEFGLSGHACSCVPGWECHDDECVPASMAPVDAGEPDAGAPDSGEPPAPIVLPCGTAERPNLLFDPTFETNPLSALPSEAEVWGGDAAERVAEEGGVTPSVGEHMLAFRGTAPEGPSTFGAAQVFQLVSKASARFSVGDHIVACASFNRVVGDSRSDTRFGLRVYGYEGDMAAFYDAYGQLRNTFDPARADVWTDADPSTWERACVEARIDDDANYLAVELQAVENIENDLDGVEFDGHFVDDACLALLRAQ